MTTTFLVEVDALSEKLHYFEEPHFFKALFSGNVAQAYNLIDYTDISLWAKKASEKIYSAWYCVQFCL